MIEQLEAKLIEYNYSMEIYEIMHAALATAGYSKGQADRIIFQPKAMTSFDKLIQFSCSDKAQEFSKEELTIIATHPWGVDHFEIALKLFANLREKGFLPNTILQLFACIHEACPVEKVIENLGNLLELGFSIYQVQWIVLCCKNEKNLQALTAALSNLRAMGFSAEEVVRFFHLCANLVNLEALATSLSFLHEAGFTSRLLFQLATESKRFDNLMAEIDILKKILVHNVPAKSLSRLLSYNGIFLPPSFIMQKIFGMKLLGFTEKTAAMIVTFYNNPDAYNRLSVMIKEGFTRDCLDKLLSRKANPDSFEQIANELKALHERFRRNSELASSVKADVVEKACTSAGEMRTPTPIRATLARTASVAESLQADAAREGFVAAKRPRHSMMDRTSCAASAYAPACPPL